MAINFPNSPANNQVFIDSTSGAQYIYDATTTKWRSYALQYSLNYLTTSASLDYGLITDSITGSVIIDYGSLV